MTFVMFTRRILPLATVALLVCGTSAMAGEPDGLFRRDRLGGDLGGLRPALAARGVEIGADYTGEILGNVSGGVKRGAVYDGRITLSLDADLGKLAGWRGARAHASAIEVHGRGPSADLLGGNLMDVSNIEARPEARLYTLWLEQSLFDGKVSIRAGQIGADDDFLISDTASNLLNGTFGWAALASSDMTAGGPVYPLPTPGLRVRVRPSPETAILAAMFSGNPGGADCSGDPQLCNRHGTTFSFGGGTLWMGEVQYAPQGVRLPGTYKIGAWRETGAFTDQFTGKSGRHGDYGVYAIADQAVWRPAGGETGLNVFLRGGAASANRNLVSWYVDGGFGLTGPFAGRKDDTLTLGVAYGRISGDAADADRAAGPPTPVRDYESVIELTYAASVAPWWTVQPDLQYVIHPGGNVANPDGGGAVRNAFLLGIRTVVTF